MPISPSPEIIEGIVRLQIYIDQQQNVAYMSNRESDNDKI
jgi:hypothetical protein